MNERANLSNDLAQVLAECRPDPHAEPSAWACWDNVVEGVAAKLALIHPAPFNETAT